MPDNADTVNNYWMTRTVHIATDAIVFPQLVFSNWHTAYNGDAGGGTTATYTASIEYPAGTFYQAKFSGATSGTAASGKDLYTDAMASVSIPKGATFYVRVYRVHAAGSFAAPFMGGGNIFGNISLSNTLGDATTYGSSSAVTDQTMGGTVAQTGTSYYAAGPTAIIAQTQQVSALLIGDSRVDGVNDQSTTSSPATGELSKAFWNAQVGYIHAGASADQALFWTQAKHTLVANLAPLITAVVSNHSINDVTTGGATAAQLLGYQQTIQSFYFPSKKYWICTISPYTTSTDNWATTTNQTPVTGNAARVSYNTTLRAGGISGIAGVFDLATATESATNSGFWVVNGTANYATNDGLHEQPGRYLLIPNPGPVTPLSITR